MTEQLNERDKRFELLRQKKYLLLNAYITEQIKTLSIEIGAKKEQPILYLIKNGLLEGWCWETTSLVVPFLENANIVRGNLTFWPGEKYYHAWCELPFENEMYVFDLCLRFLCLKSDFDKILETEIMAKIPAEKCRKEIIELLSENDEKDIFILGTDNIEDVFYRSRTTISGVVEKDKILSLKSHFYFNG